MNLHVKNNQALGVPKVASEARVSNPCSSTARLKWFVWPAVVCIGLMVSNTAVLGNTGKAKPKPNVAKTKQPKASEREYFHARMRREHRQPAAGHPCQNRTIAALGVR